MYTSQKLKMYHSRETVAHVVTAVSLVNDQFGLKSKWPTLCRNLIKIWHPYGVLFIFSMLPHISLYGNLQILSRYFIRIYVIDTKVIAGT
jgi:hypothetical protein